MIKVSGLNKFYGKQHVLNNISFEINGGVVGFLGPNGAGKSTTMKILTGYLNADSGHASIMGHKVTTEKIEVKRLIGYLPEHNPLYKEMYIKEYLQHVAKLYKLGNVNAKVNKVIELTDLGLEQQKKIKQLSKGYRQRVGLAQAIIHDPKILILDEPTSGLDPNQIVEIRNLITELGKEKTILLSTHIMQEVEAMCGRVMILNKGEMVKDSPIVKQTIQNSSTKRYQVRFKGTFFIEELSQIQGVEKVAPLNNGFLVYISNEASPTLLFDFAVDKNIKLELLAEHNQSMEGVFRSATNS